MSSRDKRPNAGKRIHQLVEKEAEVDDEFYKNLYGGFDDMEEDTEYIDNNEEPLDIEDSDISTDDESESSDFKDESEAEKTKKKVKKKSIHKKTNISNVDVKKEIKRETNESLLNTSYNDESNNEKKIQKNSAKKSSQYIRSKNVGKSSSSPKIKTKRMTQEEHLAEAYITEMKNIESLKEIKNRTLNCNLNTKEHPIMKRNKDRSLQNLPDGSYIKFLSSKHPVINGNSILQPYSQDNTRNKEYCCRNFLILSQIKNSKPVAITDSMSLLGFKSTKKIENQQPKICAITGNPAKYKDPLTGLYYHNIQSFKLIRHKFDLQKNSTIL